MAALVYSSCQNLVPNIFSLPAKSLNICRHGNVNKLIKHYLTISKELFTRRQRSSYILTSNVYKPKQITTLLPIGSSLNICNSNSDLHCKVRSFSTDGPVGSPKRSLPPLMEFPELVWPSLIKTIRNWILSTLIIPPYFDQEFSLYSFVKGSKHAVQVVSHNMSEGNYKSLEGLVVDETLNTIQKSLSQLSLAQRQQLAITKEDIYYSFPYQVGVMFDETNSAVQRTFVEITMVYHVLKGLSAMRSRGEEPPLSMGLMPEYRDKIYICNYRFIREFTKGVNDQWTVNLVNHFKPNDFI